MPDLTKSPQQEEASMNDEADRRNRDELTDDDVPKKLYIERGGPAGRSA
jgi:hypothetical protein